MAHNFLCIRLSTKKDYLFGTERLSDSPADEPRKDISLLLTNILQNVILGDFFTGKDLDVFFFRNKAFVEGMTGKVGVLLYHKIVYKTTLCNRDFDCSVAALLPKMTNEVYIEEKKEKKWEGTGRGKTSTTKNLEKLIIKNNNNK